MLVVIPWSVEKCRAGVIFSNRGTEPTFVEPCLYTQRTGLEKAWLQKEEGPLQLKNVVQHSRFYGRANTASFIGLCALIFDIILYTNGVFYVKYKIHLTVVRA